MTGYTLGILFLMGINVCVILAESEEPQYAKSEEEDEEDEEDEEEEEDIEEEDEIEDCHCLPIRRPLCASNDETYSSKCKFKCALAKDPSLTIKHLGSCDDTMRWLFYPHRRTLRV